jgi:hypothetical protein
LDNSPPPCSARRGERHTRHRRRGRVTHGFSTRKPADFLALLKKFDKQGRNVSHRNGPSYAPAAFASNAGEKAKFAAAMNRLFEAEKIKVEEHGPASRRRSRIVANG